MSCVGALVRTLGIKMTELAETIMNAMDEETQDGMQTQAETANDVSPTGRADGIGPPVKQKRKRGSGKPRPPSRPYKKYTRENLEGKVVKMKKQVELQRSKLLILEDKLEKHEQEISFRDQQETEGEGA